ncbi:MAG TPA: TetR/AcrR family transcriptional regulator [Dehalococcoidia bacterium]|nr:TetR/AcrR family transcriptional regulator [Dehalococcoidia bacterium]
MPKVLPEYLEQRKVQIVDAAAACFARRGFHQTTMQDICEESSLSPGAVYRYFHSKEEIIEAMCERGQVADADAIRRAMELGGTLDTLDELARIFLLGLDERENCALMIELIAEASRSPFILDSVRRSRRVIREPLIEYIRDAQARGDFDASLDPEAVARTMVSLSIGLLVQYAAEPEMDVNAYAAAVKALFGGRFWQGATIT